MSLIAIEHLEAFFVVRSKSCILNVCNIHAILHDEDMHQCDFRTRFKTPEEEKTKRILSFIVD